MGPDFVATKQQFISTSGTPLIPQVLNADMSSSIQTAR
jgi:hypothetical protein